MDYLPLKHLHMSLVGLSVAGFTLRGLAAMAGARWVRARAVRIVPHVVDTLLLATGLWLVFTLGTGMAAAPWFSAKMIGLVAYVLLGVVALRPGTGRGLRVVAWVAALAIVGWMWSVARTKNPAGFLGPLL